MQKHTKKNNHELHRKESQKDYEEGKDYAHYPPAPAEQVKPPAHKQVKHNEENINDNPGTTHAQTNKSRDEKVLNGSEKIVNATDESYSDGSGGGFEATEQVNE